MSESVNFKPGGGFDPVRRVIAVHAASLPDRREICPACKAGAKNCRVCDARQCRIWLNEAQREIDRLRRSLASPPPPAGSCRPCDTFTTSHPGKAAEPEGPTSCRRVSRIYAPPALGDVSQLTSRMPPPPPPEIPIANHYHVTNLGTLLDVLA